MKLWKTNNKYFEIPSPHGPNHCCCSFIGKVFRLYHLLTLCYHLGLRFLTLQEESSTIFVPASTIMVSWSSFMPWSTECSRYKLLAPFRVLSLSLSASGQRLPKGLLQLDSLKPPRPKSFLGVLSYSLSSRAHSPETLHLWDGELPRWRGEGGSSLMLPLDQLGAKWKVLFFR